MKTQNPDEVRRLTADDPVSQEELGSLSELEEAETRVARQLLLIEQKRIYLLASAKKIEMQRNRVFEQILVDRGLPLDSIIDLDHRTGEIRVEQTNLKK